MTIGPDPMTRTFLISLYKGIKKLHYLTKKYTENLLKGQ